MKLILLAMLAFLSAFFGGCSSYKADEVSRTMTYPLVFTDTIDATGIEKETRPDGTVVRKAANLVHTTTILGFTRTSKYKGAEIASPAEENRPPLPPATPEEPK